MIKICTLFSLSHIPLFTNYFSQTVPKGIDCYAKYITDFAGKPTTKDYNSQKFNCESKMCGIEKIKLINQMLKLSNANLGHIIIYADVDVIFNNDLKDFEQEIKNILFNYDMVFKSDSPKDFSQKPFNTGIILIKVNERTREFFKAMYEERKRCLNLELNELELMNRRIVDFADLKWKFADDVILKDNEEFNSNWIAYHAISNPDVENKMKVLDNKMKEKNELFLEKELK